MGNIIDILGAPFKTTEPQEARPTDMQVREAMQAAGIEAPEVIIADGNLHRFKSSQKDKDKAGWYVINDGQIPAGAFGCWREGIECNFRADTGRELSAAEEMAHARYIREAKLKKEAERKRQHETAASTVKQIWDNAASALQDHPYLVRKGINAHNARVTGDGRLVVPLFDSLKQLKSLQYIAADGTKRYHTGGETKTNFWNIGTTELVKTIYIAEGFATAATIHETTHAATFIAYSASNIPAVTGMVKNLWPEHKIVIVADNDESGTGLNYADQAAAKYGARVVMPPTPGQDANDYKEDGNDLAALLNPPIDDWLMPADDFCAQPSPIKWLVKHWIQEDALIMMHGPSGGGKTFVVLDMCLSMAAGLNEWCGNKVKAGAVVYLAGEGHHGLRGRIAAWKQEHAPSARLNMWLSKSGLDLNTQAGYKRTVETIQQLPTPPKIIIVDTLHRFLEGDENSAKDAKSMLDACAMLMAQFGCSVLLVHHTGVSDETQHRARGSSAWRGALDIEISIAPGKADNPLKISQMKSKDSEAAEPLFANLKSIPIDGWFDEDQEQVTSAVLQQDEAPPTTDKKDSKLIKHRKLFCEAWLAMGKEVVNEKPYISRSAFKHFLTEKMDLTETTASIYVRPSQQGRPICELLSGGIIETSDNGWCVADQVVISSLLIQK